MCNLINQWARVAFKPNTIVSLIVHHYDIHKTGVHHDDTSYAITASIIKCIYHDDTTSIYQVAIQTHSLYNQSSIRVELTTSLTHGNTLSYYEQECDIPFMIHNNVIIKQVIRI